jgi:hypothetical protein
MKPPKNSVRVTIDDELYIDSIFIGEQDGQYVWDFNVVLDEDVIAYFVKYESQSGDVKEAVEQLLNDTGPVNNDMTKVVWHLMPY